MIPVAAEAPVWAHELARRVDSEIREQTSQPVRLPTFVMADLPSAARHRTCWIYVSDESGGAVPAFSDGTDWRRCTDRAVIS